MSEDNFLGTRSSISFCYCSSVYSRLSGLRAFRWFSCQCLPLPYAGIPYLFSCGFQGLYLGHEAYMAGIFPHQTVCLTCLALFQPKALFPFFVLNFLFCRKKHLVFFEFGRDRFYVEKIAAWLLFILPPPTMELLYFFCLNNHELRAIM